MAAAKDFGKALDQHSGAGAFNPALQQALYNPGAEPQSGLLSKVGNKAAPRVPSTSAAGEVRGEQARPSSAQVEDQAARLTHKSAESEAHNFDGFLHRHWAGAPDGPVYAAGPSEKEAKDVRGFDSTGHVQTCIEEGLKHADKPLHGNPNDQLRNETNPCELGGQWLTGKGPRHQAFHDGDAALRELQRHDHLQHVRKKLRFMAGSNNFPQAIPYKNKEYDHYSLAGSQGVTSYGNDSGVNCLIRDKGCERGNLTVAYLGSYNLDYKVVANDTSRRELTVHFHASNKSDLPSLSHVPVVGYKQWWKDNVEAPLARHQSGSMSPTSQDFYWSEIINY